ncbi:MAG: Clp protease N-terminal domain-containing protein [Pseudonocardia sp.]|nr:Clp protease N-terminal domain-containing protein [Pseudonocardia sp.]
MPKINVYLPDELAAAVREAGIPVSSVCQRALADAVSASTGESPQGARMTENPQADTPGWTRMTARARTAVRSALRAGEERDNPATSVDLLAGVVAEGENLALTVLAALGVEPPDLLSEARGLAARAGAAPADLASTLVRSTEEAVRLEHNYIGCEHLLLGLAGGPAEDPVRAALASTGVDRRAARTAVGAAVAGIAFTRTQQAAAGLSAPVRTVLEDIRARLTRLERGTTGT